MLPAWLDADLCAMICWGVGGVVIGLLGFYGKDRRWDVALLGLILTGAACLGWWGAPAKIWAPPATLALFCMLGRISRDARLLLLGQRLFSSLRRRRVQALLLLLLGPTLALGLMYRLEQKLAPSDDAAGSLNLRPLESDSHPAGQATTDKGRPIQLLHKSMAQEEQVVLREREAKCLQNRACNLIRIAAPDETSNCHGWTFTEGAFWVPKEEIEKILEDNGYCPVSTPTENDIIVYYDGGGEISHSGLVRAAPDQGPVLIESKWGGLGRYIHQPSDTPYGIHFAYFHSERTHHNLLQGMPPTNDFDHSVLSSSNN